jgi:selenocysteine lyase/cysteine desulfurase
MSDAIPPEGAVPVESPLLRRLYATREWSETQALLTDDFVWHDERGKRRRAKHLKHATQWAERQLKDLHGMIEATSPTSRSRRCSTCVTGPVDARFIGIGPTST